jgi:hypothetical protein
METGRNIEAWEKVCYELQGQVKMLTSKVEFLTREVDYLKSEIAQIRNTGDFQGLLHQTERRENVGFSGSSESQITPFPDRGLDEKANEESKLDEETSQLKQALFKKFEALPWDTIKAENDLDETRIRRLFNMSEELEVSLQKLVYLSPKDINPDNLVEEFETLAKIRPQSIEGLFYTVKNSFNLLSNPSGASGFNNWTVSNESGSIVIESFGTFKDKETVFATSFGWGTLEQLINVPVGRTSERVLVVGAMCARRKDCGSKAIVELEVNGEVLRTEATLQNTGENAQISDWQMLRVVKKIGGAAEVAKIRVKGKDEKYWAGNYGARIGYCFAYCFELR